MPEPCMVFRDGTRYKVADQRLRYMIQTLRDFHYGECNLLLCKWQEFEEPTDEERERINWLLGEQEAKRILDVAERKRYRNKELVKTSASLNEYHNRYIAERMMPLVMTAERYNEYLTGRVVPNIEKSKFSIFEYYRLFEGLDRYKTERRNSVIIHKGAKQDILEFHKYRRERLANSEQSLQWDAEGLKMNNSDVLEEYKFLYHAIRMICPLVFEPPNAELQTHIVYDDLVKEHATRELAKKMGAVYAGNAYKRKTKNPDKTIVYDYKRKKKVPHKIHIVDNRKRLWILVIYRKMKMKNCSELSSVLIFQGIAKKHFLNYRTWFVVNFFSVNASGLIWANRGFS